MVSLESWDRKLTEQEFGSVFPGPSKGERLESARNVLGHWKGCHWWRKGSSWDLSTGLGDRPSTRHQPPFPYSLFQLKKWCSFYNMASLFNLFLGLPALTVLHNLPSFLLSLLSSFVPFPLPSFLPFSFILLPSPTSCSFSSSCCCSCPSCDLILRIHLSSGVNCGLYKSLLWLGLYELVLSKAG